MLGILHAQKVIFSRWFMDSNILLLQDITAYVDQFFLSDVCYPVVVGLVVVVVVVVVVVES
jgi:hypothetical protein